MGNNTQPDAVNKATSVTADNPMTKGDPSKVEHEKAKEKKHHEKAVENTFPASDPPATSQPGSGITGPSDPRERNKGA